MVFQIFPEVVMKENTTWIQIGSGVTSRVMPSIVSVNTVTVTTAKRHLSDINVVKLIASVV